MQKKGTGVKAKDLTHQTSLQSSTIYFRSVPPAEVKIPITTADHRNPLQMVTLRPQEKPA